MIPAKRYQIALLLIGIITLGWFTVEFMSKRKNQPNSHLNYRYEIVDKGNITNTVNATGTINPVTLINVGSQVSGTVVELKADFNDHVRRGQVLLKLDPTIFNAQIQQSEANLASSEASMRLAQLNFERNSRLVAQNYVSSLTLDQSIRELDVAKANVKLAKAQLARASADLDNSVIRAPIDGIIVKRTIDLGQTVAAAFATPNLFQIARDLKRMQIDTNFSEADIGSLKNGQSARFMVDAYPAREFDATVRQFRLAASVLQNVVTYNVVLDVENNDHLLKPGMTAQVRVLVGKKLNTLRIPTAALRLKISDDDQKKLAEDTKQNPQKPAFVRQPSDANENDDFSFLSKNETNHKYKIYKINIKNQLVPTDVTIGLSNFRFTEILNGDLNLGDRIATRAFSPLEGDTR
jgi:HlyD family secretion protein